MANIEHRDVESVLSAYDFFEKPNFAIYCGKEQRAFYDGGNDDEGRKKLEEWLTMIAQGQTGATYTLRVYPENIKEITARNEPSGSTTFNLQNSIVPHNANGNGGVMLINQGRQQPAGPANEFLQRLDKLENDNAKLREDLHTQQLKTMEDNFTAQIAGLKESMAATPSAWERVGEYIAERPEVINDTLKTLGNIVAGIFGKQVNFITNPGAVNNPVQGTNKDHMENEVQTEHMPQLTAEGAYIHPFLSDEEKKEKKSVQFKLMQERLTALPTEDVDTEQMLCIQILETRIGAVNVTHLLIAVASLDNEDLNKVLNNLA